MPATTGRSSRSIAPTCTRCCSTPRWQRLGRDAVRLDHRCLSGRTGQRRRHAALRHGRAASSAARSRWAATASIRRCAGSSIPTRARRNTPGVNMWRGAARWPPFLAGDTMVLDRLDDGRQDGDLSGAAGHARDGRQPLINWVAEIERPEAVRQDWTGRGRLADMMPAFAGLKFDWLDISGMIESTEEILEYPMVDRDPLPRWTLRPHHAPGRCRPSDVSARLQRRGPGDHRCALSHRPDQAARRHASRRCSTTRRCAVPRPPMSCWPTATIRPTPSCARSGSVRAAERFERIDDVISAAELQAISDRYKKVAGFDRESLRTRPSFV